LCKRRALQRIRVPSGRDVAGGERRRSAARRMSERTHVSVKRLSLPPVVLLALAVALIAVGCGGKQTADKKLATILGHQPTGLAADIAASGKLVIANDENYPPQSFTDPKTKKVVGFDVDVGKRVCEILGLTPVFKQVVFETIPQGLKNGRFQLSIGSMPVTPEFAKVVDFTQPYAYAEGQMLVKAGGPSIAKVRDLTGLTVGVGADAMFFDFLMKYSPKVTVVAFPTDAEMLAALRKGQIDAAMTDALSASQDVIVYKKLQKSGPPLVFEPLAFAVDKNQADLVALLNYAIDTMHKDGSLTTLSQRWYGGMDLTAK
jgi:ABC-type amino acid transport substrate-binding protein